MPLEEACERIHLERCARKRSKATGAEQSIGRPRRHQCAKVLDVALTPAATANPTATNVRSGQSPSRTADALPRITPTRWLTERSRRDGNYSPSPHLQCGVSCIGPSGCYGQSRATADACVTPVLGLTEAPADPHLAARGSYVDVDGVAQPGVAPRFSRTPGAVRGAPRLPGEDTRSALAAWGIAEDEVARLLDDGVVAG